MLMTFHLFLIVMKIVGRDFPRTAFPPQRRGLSSFLGVAEFLKSLFEMRLEPKTNQAWEMGSVKEFLLFVWHKPLEKFFSKLHSFTALLQKGWGFPQRCGGMGIGSEFHGIYLQELLFSLTWSLGHCVSILKGHIYLCVLFCANKKYCYFCL